MTNKFNKEYKEKLDIETKKMQEHLEVKYKDDLDSLNSKFSQNEKEIEAQNLKITSLKEEIKVHINQKETLEEENKNKDVEIERMKEELKVLPLTSFDLYHTKTRFYSIFYYYYLLLLFAIL